MPSLRQQLWGEYCVWLTMRQRCINPKNRDYQNYGSRGIECRFETFTSFIQELGPRPQGLTLERIDNNGHYEPGNVRWDTRRQQSCNKRNTKRYQYNGKCLSVMQWAEELNLPYAALYARLHRGWNVEKALTTPFRISPK